MAPAPAKPALDTIRGRLAQLNRLDPEFRMPLADAHRYRLNPVVDQQVLTRAEEASARHRR
jgi:hypothetical protein